MSNQARSLLFAAVAGLLLGLMFVTPFGYVWGFITFTSQIVIESFLPQPINSILWLILCYLITLITFWCFFLKCHGLPQQFFMNLERRIK